MRRGRLPIALLVACILVFAGAGCGGEKAAPPLSPGAAQTTPVPPPDPCEDQAEGRAQDGANDEQGGSTPGIDPCDGPGN